MARMSIDAEIRPVGGKGAARRLRRQGKVPGIVYGRGKEGLKIQVDANRLAKLLASNHSGLVDLKVNGETRVVLVREVQRTPDRGVLLHVDFHEVSLDQEVETAVPLVLVGEDRRASDGGVLVQTLREVTVSCRAADIPERIEVDVSGMTVGDILTVADLVAPPGVTITDPPEELVVSVTLPERAGAGEAPAEGGDGDAAEGQEE